MKKCVERILCVILILTMTLTACGKTPATNSEGNENQNSQAGNLQDGENNEDDNEEIAKEKSAILEDAVVVDEEGMIYYVSNERIESSLQQEIALYNENLLLWGSGVNDAGESGFFLSLISLQTGEVLQEKMFSDMELPNAQVCGDKVAVIDWGNGSVTVLDSQFKVLDEYETDTSYCTIYLNNEATKIYCFTQDGVKVMDTEDGSTKKLFEEATMLFASSKCGDVVSVTYTDKETQMGESGIVDLSTGTAEKIPYEGAFHSVESDEGIWLAGVLGEENTYYLGKADRPKEFSPQGEYAMVTLLAEPLRLMTTNYNSNGQSAMTLYSLDGKYLSQCIVPEGASVIYEPIWSEADGGYFLIAIDNTGKDMLLFWDMSVPTVGEDLMLKSAYEEADVADSSISKELLDRATSIGTKYGVEIYIGDQTEDSYGEYRMAHEMNETYIEEGLDALESALSKYPNGFMKQLLYGNQKTLEFHLTGAFTLKEYPEGNVNGFTSYIGFAEEQEGKNVVVVDITMAGSIEQTLHHEIMHIIDNKLVFDANVRNDAMYSEETWNELNPAGFSYVGDKYHLPANIYNDGYEGYFVDVYSRTFAREDRARIMEYAMVEADWTFSNADGRCEKLEYLCKCIRDAFDTEGWPEKTVWEKTLERSQ